MATINKDTIKQVKKLYYKDKLSVQGVARELGVSIDAVFYCMRRNKLKRRRKEESNSIRYEKSEPSFKLEKIDNEKLRRLKIAGVMLYWGEGCKSDKTKVVDFANSDESMIMLFLKFLRKVCGVDEKRLRAYPYLYSNQKAKKCIEFWNKITKINKKQFTKPYIRKDYDKSKINKMPHGLIHIRYADKKLLNLIKSWIKEYRKL